MCWSTRIGLPSGSTITKLAGPVVDSSAAVTGSIPRSRRRRNRSPTSVKVGSGSPLASQPGLTCRLEAERGVEGPRRRQVLDGEADRESCRSPFPAPHHARTTMGRRLLGKCQPDRHLVQSPALHDRPRRQHEPGVVRVEQVAGRDEQCDRPFQVGERPTGSARAAARACRAPPPATRRGRRPRTRRGVQHGPRARGVPARRSRPATCQLRVPGVPVVARPPERLIGRRPGPHRSSGGRPTRASGHSTVRDADPGPIRSPQSRGRWDRAR
jgi:hypothetical protein